MNGYTAVSLKNTFIDRIEEQVQIRGFSGRAEFVRYCIIKELERRRNQAKHNFVDDQSSYDFPGDKHEWNAICSPNKPRIDCCHAKSYFGVKK